MKIIQQKLFSTLLLLAVLFSFAPFSVSALTYEEIKTAQQGKVLGDSAPYATGSLVSDGGVIYFIYQQLKVPFTSQAVFTGLGYSLANVTHGDLSGYSLSTDYVISSSRAAHPWGTW